MSKLCIAYDHNAEAILSTPEMADQFNWKQDTHIGVFKYDEALFLIKEWVDDVDIGDLVQTHALCKVQPVNGINRYPVSMALVPLSKPGMTYQPYRMRA